MAQRFRDLNLRDRKKLLREYHGIGARLARRLGVDGSAVSRVARGQAKSERVLAALDAEFEPILTQRAKQQEAAA